VGAGIPESTIMVYSGLTMSVPVFVIRHRHRSLPHWLVSITITITMTSAVASRMTMTNDDDE
jgi:hypothetical protein